MFAMFVCLHLCITCAAYVQMGGNWCKCMLCCTSLGPSEEPERPLFPGLYLIIVKNYETIIVPIDSLNLAHPIAVVEVKP